MSDATDERRAGLFPALLKHWRHRRGLSQLDLAIAADVSARHVSFLETGRSRPSEEMVLRLAATLGVPLRHTNALLSAAGHEEVYAEGSVEDVLTGEVAEAVALMKHHAEPFPLVVIDRAYDVLDLNTAAAALLAAVVRRPEAIAGRPNLLRTTFDPDGAHGAIANIDDVGRSILWRAQREALEDPGDERLRTVLDEVLAMPTVDPDWRDVDLAAPSEPAIGIHLRRGPLDVRFLTTVTAFVAPQQITLEELRVELWLPRDDATVAACRRMVDSHTGRS